MKYIKTILSALLACAIIAPSIALAEDNEQYFYSDTDIILYDTSDNTDELTDEETAFVNDMITALKNQETEIDLTDKYRLSAERVEKLRINLYYAIQYEHPELSFYTNVLNRYSYYTADNYISKIELETFYTMTSDEISEKQKMIDAEYEKIKSLIADDMTPLQQLLTVHDYIAANYEYDTTLQSRTLDTMIEQKSGVCQGYSYLFKYVLDSLGIECVTVPSTENSHMWNKVKLDGEWYNVDVTYDDPQPDTSTNISHLYFLLNDDEIREIDDSLDYSDENVHSTWDPYKWDDNTPVEVSDSRAYSKSALHDIPKQTVYKDGEFYCFDDDNDICVIDFEDNDLKPVYKASSEYKWHIDGNRYYSDMSAMVLYKGDIYFNSPNNVFKFNPNDNTVKQIYSYGPKDSDIAHIYGLKIKDDKINIEYTENYRNGISELIPISVKPEMPCSSEISMEDGEVTVTLNIPEEYTDTASVYIAEYDEKGILTGIHCKDDTTFKPQDNSKEIKAFIWDNGNMPIANVIMYMISTLTE